MSKPTLVVTYDANDNEVQSREIDYSIREFRHWLRNHLHWAINEGYAVEVTPRESTQ